MKIIAFVVTIISLFFGAQSALASDETEVHVVLVAGQSNAVGADTMEQSYVKLKYPERVMQIGRFSGNDMKLIPARYPLDHHTRRPGHFGFALQFSIDYMKANPDVRLVLVPCARGATGFSTGEWGVGSFLYKDSVARTNRALAEDNARLVAILWAQGERDANRGHIAKEDYRNALDLQLHAWRRDIRGAENVPIILGQMVPAFVEKKDRWGIAEVIADTPLRIANTYLVSGEGAEVHGASTPDDPSDDQIIHYSANGNRTLGTRYAQILLSLQ